MSDANDTVSDEQHAQVIDRAILAEKRVFRLRRELLRARAEVRFLVFAAHTGSTHNVCLHGIPYTASGPCPSCSYYRMKHGLNPGHPTPAQEDAEMAAALKAARK